MNKGLKILFLVMLFGIVLTYPKIGLWDQIPTIKTTVHAAFDPSLGKLLQYNLILGMLVITAIMGIITTLFQKYGTDQGTLKKIRAEQKILQEEMKKFKEHPEKLMELQKKQFEFIPQTMDITSRPIMYTAIPFLLLLRWFNDYFTLYPSRILGMSWILAYILFSLVFSIAFRKILKVH